MALTSGASGARGYMLKDLLIPSKRIIDNIALPLRLKGVLRSGHARSGTRWTWRVAQSWPHELSGGMRRRCCVLRTALIGSDVSQRTRYASQARCPHGEEMHYVAHVFREFGTLGTGDHTRR